MAPVLPLAGARQAGNGNAIAKLAVVVAVGDFAGPQAGILCTC